jgi:uncharacterized protein
MLIMTGIDEVRRYLPGRHQIDGYGRGGFLFGGLSHQGSILALPSGIGAWPCLVPADFTPDLLAAVEAEAAEIDLFLFGCGADMAYIAPPVHRFFRELGIKLDVMTTAAAARTYNVLVAEDRRVAAGLIAVQA